MSSTPPDGEGLNMMWWAARHPPSDPKTSFAGQTVLITGANTGLGYETALKFAALGASRLIFGVRSLHKGEEARARICQQTGYDISNIQLYELDMSTFASVKTFAEATAKEPRLDIAVLNAGLMATSYRVSPEGYEMSLQVMVLSTALLGMLLLPQLQKSAAMSGVPAHIEFVGSIAGRSVKPDTFSRIDAKILDRVNQPGFFDVQKQYNVSKLLLFYVLDSLAESTSSASVIINAVCPGPCRTDLGRDFPSWLRVPLTLMQSALARSAEEGARSYVSGVTLGQEAHGQLWSADMFLRHVKHINRFLYGMLTWCVVKGSLSQVRKARCCRRKYGEKFLKCCNHIYRVHIKIEADGICTMSQEFISFMPFARLSESNHTGRF